MVLVLILKYYILCQLNSSQSIIYPDKIRTQLFKVKDFVNEHIVKNWTFLLPFFLNIKYDIYTNIFFAGEKKMLVACKSYSNVFSAKIPVNYILYLLEHITFWALTSSLG